MPSNNIRAGVKNWVQGNGLVKTSLINGLAELIGTFFLVFIGCTGCVGTLGVVPPHLQITLTFGLAVMVVIQCVGHISHAHVNPAVTVASVILGKKTILEAVIYFISQMIGGILGYGMLKIVTPAAYLSSSSPDKADLFCVTDVHTEISAVQGLLIEGIATAVLILVVCAVWDVRNEKNSDSVPIRFGLTVAVLATAFGPYTGCSMNPARSFAPALWNNQWSHHWVYWFGPIGGALITSFMYRTIFGVQNQVEEEGIAEAVALNSLDGHKMEQP